MTEELSAYGYKIAIQDWSTVDSIVKVLNFQYSGKSGVLGKIRIKLEVNINPPDGSEYKIKYLDFPFVSSVCPCTQTEIP